MGTSIDSAVTKWEKVKKICFRPNSLDSFSLPKDENEKEAFYNIMDAFEKANGLHYYEAFNDSTFSQRYYDFYVRKSNEFLKLLNDFPESNFKKWISDYVSKVEHSSLLFHCNYDTFFVSDTCEEYERNMWKPMEYAPLGEDGKLLNMAMGNLDSLYGVSLSSVCISRDELDDYDENHEYSMYLDRKIAWDTSDLAKIMEFALDTIQPKPHDEFFEERMPRLRILLEALKKGAKFVYSV